MSEVPTPRNFIKLVGFELEGGWKGEPCISPFDDCTLIDDHSINGQTLGGAAPIRATHVGELVSEPMPLTSPWKEWLETHWPNADPPDRTNRTCGFHIHTSYEDLKCYTLLTSKSFLLLLKDRMHEVAKEVKLPKRHPFWGRLNGDNSFCSFFFEPHEQMKVNMKGINRVRYGWLNFSWGLHGTLEFRMLPTFRDSWVAVRFASAFFDLVNNWLEKTHDAVLVREKFNFKG